MNYSALIQNRKSVREFTDKQVFFGDLDKIRDYYNRSVRRLLPEIKTELLFFGTDARAALEGSAGYNQFLVGAPQYLILLSEKHPMAHLNAGYIMEDLILMLTDMISTMLISFPPGRWRICRRSRLILPLVLKMYRFLLGHILCLRRSVASSPRQRWMNFG